MTVLHWKPQHNLSCTFAIYDFSHTIVSRRLNHLLRSLIIKFFPSTAHAFTLKLNDIHLHTSTPPTTRQPLRLIHHTNPLKCLRNAPELLIFLFLRGDALSSHLPAAPDYEACGSDGAYTTKCYHEMSESRDLS